MCSFLHNVEVIYKTCVEDLVIQVTLIINSITFGLAFENIARWDKIITLHLPSLYVNFVKEIVVLKLKFINILTYLQHMVLHNTQIYKITLSISYSKQLTSIRSPHFSL